MIFFRASLVLIIISLQILSTCKSSLADNVITIVPGSAEFNSPGNEEYKVSRLFDANYYIAHVNETVTWFNADDANHQLDISQGRTLIIKSKAIKPNETFSYKFAREGFYNFSSSQFKWMKGNIVVSNNVSSMASKGKANPVNVQLLWYPPISHKARLPEPTHFIITFLESSTNKNQDHIDYGFSLLNGTNDTVYRQELHSAWGVEQASTTLNNSEKYKAVVEITGIQFQPVNPDRFLFNLY